MRAEGLRDYLGKIGLQVRCCWGLSGGIDSAIVATIAADAHGTGQCALCDAAVRLYTPQASLDDAAQMSRTTSGLRI